MAGYIGSRASVVSSGAERKKTFDITGTTTSLTGLSYTPTFVHLFHNGVRLVDGTDFTATNGSSITLTSAAESGDEVVVISYATFQAADAYTKAETYTKSEADDEFVNDPNSVISVSGSNVGIGTSSPDAKLDVSRTGNGQIAVLQTSSNRGFSFESQSDTALQIASVQGSTNLDLWANTLTFSAGGTERLRIDSSGRVTTPYQPSFCVGDGQSVQGPSIVKYQNVRHNIGGHYNASNGRFTAPVTGVYHFECYIQPHTTTYLTYSSITWQINGSQAITSELVEVWSGGSDHRIIGGSIALHMNAGDYMDVNATRGYRGIQGYMSGHLIG